MATRGGTMARKYELKRRAERQRETRQRIVEATVTLHMEGGAANATVSAIARRAGVERPTVYRHFPDERTLFSACTGHYLSVNPPPDPAPWALIDDAEGRLRAGLTAIYAFFHRVEPMLASLAHDLYNASPALLDALAPYFAYWDRVRTVLAEPWIGQGADCALARASVGHAIDFQSWRSLVRQQGLDDTHVVDLMAAM